MERLDIWLDQAMREVERSEKEESGEYRLPEELAEKQKLRETIQESLTQLKTKERESMHPGEPDAQMMKTREGTRLGYNAQAVVDSKAGVIVAGEVTTDQNDTHQLVPMLEVVQKELGKVAEETAADGGYFSGEQLDKAQKAALPVLVNLVQLRKAEEDGGPYHSSKFEYDSENDCCLCPMGQKLKFEGIRKRKNKSHEMRAYRCKARVNVPFDGIAAKTKRGGV
jgi:hypothetical protein